MSKNYQTILKYRFIVLAGSLILIFVGSGSLFLIAVTLKDLALEFNWPRETPSLAFSLQFIGGGLGGILMGYLLDRVGAVILPIIATFAVTSGSILTTMITEKWELFGVYLVLFGFLGQGSLYAPLMANISKWYERRRGMAVGIVASGQSLSGIVWPPVFGYVITEIGWRNGFIGFGIIALCVMLPLCLVFVRSPPNISSLQAAEKFESTALGEKPSRSARHSRTNLSHFQLQWVLSAAIIGCCVSMGLPLSHLVAHATDKGLLLTDAVTVLSVTLMAAFLSRVLIVGFLSDRYGGLWALLSFSALQTAMVALLTIADTSFLLYAVGIGFGLGYGGIFPVYAIIIREYMPLTEAGRRTGIVFLFGACAMGFGSWMGGALFDNFGNYTISFLLGVAANVTNLVIICFLLAASHPANNTVADEK